MKKTLLSMLMMGSALMANAQQTINVEFLNGDMDDDDQITVNDVTNLIGAYLEGTTPIKSITVDNTEVMDKMDYLFNWNYKQDDAIAVISDKITTNSAAIANNSYKIENNSTYIKQNVEDIKKNSDDIKELQRNITALASVISKMEADNAMMQVMIDSQENDITDLKNKNAQLQETVEILESQNRELRTAVANINNFVDELNRRIANLERQINQ